MWDSNPHGLRHQILSLACQPISAIARVMSRSSQYGIAPAPASSQLSYDGRCLPDNLACRAELVRRSAALRAKRGSHQRASEEPVIQHVRESLRTDENTREHKLRLRLTSALTRSVALTAC